MSANSHPSSSSAGEHGSTPKGPDKNGRRPSAQDLVTKPPEAKQKLEWIEQQPPSAQGQATKPPKAKRNVWEWVKQKFPSAQDQAMKPPKAKRNLWEWVKQQLSPAQDQVTKPPEANRNPEWVEQHLPSTLMATTLEKFLNDKHGDQYFVEMRFDQYTLFAPVPMTEAEIDLCERGYK
ncbi:hypothetical protein VCV18_012186 [Metarhizium anisopliae]